MNTNVLGFQSHRDHFAVAFEHAEISRRIKDLRDKELSESELRTKYALRTIATGICTTLAKSFGRRALGRKEY